MDLITTHVNADFDALGSLVAAKKLYPDSRLLLPGSQEDAVREFLSLAGEQIVVESERECGLDGIDRLILVDTRQRSRIGIAARLLERGVEVHVYDHHPRANGDVTADLDICEEVGATVSILAEIIKRKKIKLTYLEATLMLIGIYEETGSLTYRTTTRLDVDMVSFLLSQGASLAVVSSYLSRELSESELSLLTRLINSTERVTIKGIHISFIELDAGSYVGDLGVLIHKLMEIENIPALFVLVKARRDRVDIIGRSKIPALDVNRVLAHFGGGGHPGASSAKVHAQDAAEVRNALAEAIKNTIKVTVCAEDIMSRDFRTIDVNERVDAARRILLKEKLGGMPVLDAGRIAGIITLTGLNKAIKGAFGHSRVKGYMARKIVTISPETPLYAIQKIISEKDAGVIPVIRNGRIEGVVNRTDVLRSVHDSLFLKAMHRSRMAVAVNVSKKISSLLPKEALKLLRLIGRRANAAGYSAFAVGGMVRDIMLGKRNLDLDIVVEGDAIKIGSDLARELGAAIVIHRKFGTCSLYSRPGGPGRSGFSEKGPKPIKIDIATARREVYEKPAALPTVKFSSLKEDLMRRDFTINAMAVSINAKSFGQLIDFFGGVHDLHRGRIKVLHDGSFIDDPTRIFRAVRFESRLGFAMDSRTEDLIKNAIDKSMFDRVEPQRIRDELALILQEQDPLGALRRMAELEELRFVHPELRLDSDLIRLYGAIDEAAAWYGRHCRRKRALEKWLIYLMALFDDLSYNTVSSICGRFVFRGSDAIRILSYKSCSRRILKALSAKSEKTPSAIYRLLEPLSFEVILLLMAKASLLSGKRAGPARSRIEDFLQKYNGTRISVKGDDIKALGLSPSPRFKVILDEILYGKLDGKISTRGEELDYVRKLLKR
jgi:tRNA nucleotidyltransferase (CCA-adding enzyme)